MMNPLIDEDDVYIRKDGIDRTFGYLIAVLAVLLVFMLLVVGLAHLQSMSDSTITSHRNEPVVKPTEICDITVEAK